eukprot:m.292752 g.292752  ORF g.292752 m.292752 type:complete len:311 (-) comp20009_c0_seq2:2018-2950(-)
MVRTSKLARELPIVLIHWWSMSNTVTDSDLVRATKIRRKDGSSEDQKTGDNVQEAICMEEENVNENSCTDDAATANASLPHKNTIKRQAFRAKGYCVVRNYFSPEQVLAMKKASEDQLPIQSLRDQYNQPGDEKRYEYLFEPPTCCRTAVQSGVKTITSMLEPAQAFCIISEPGSHDQPWHTDSIPGKGSGLSDSQWWSTLHYIGVLTPLVATDSHNGSTDVRVASHSRSSPRGRCKDITLSMQPGDALFLDGRTMHRGRANVSKDTVRTMVFYTFKAKGFEDGNAHAYRTEDSLSKEVPHRLQAAIANE